MTTYRSKPDGSIVCPHRDLSVCPDCATDPRVVYVVGAHFLVPDPLERGELLRALAEASA